jgi:integrase
MTNSFARIATPDSGGSAMRLSEQAEKYVVENGLRARAIVSNCIRFERLTGLSDPAVISSAVIVGFRQAAIAVALSPVTIEKTVTDVLTIVRYACGSIPDVGKRLKRSRPSPQPAAIDRINAVWKAAQSQRLRRWLALVYWTGLRISDSVCLYWMLKEPCDVLRFTASKTGVHHVWPVPKWLHKFMRPVESHTGHSTIWFGRLLRDELAETCTRANIAVFTPKNLRQASIGEWTAANATAGAIVHGMGLGVMQHYLDPLAVLQSAAPRVRLPACFGATESASTEESLLCHFRRLDPAAQGLISGTAERLAAG